MAPTMIPAVARFRSSLMMLRSVEWSSQASEDLSCIDRRKPRREAGARIVARVPGRWMAVERPSRPQDGGVDAVARDRGEAVPLPAGQSSGGVPELLADGRQPNGPTGCGVRPTAGGSPGGGAGARTAARGQGGWMPVDPPSRPQDGGVDAVARARGEAVPLPAGQSSGGVPELLADGRQPNGPTGCGVRRTAGG